MNNKGPVRRVVFARWRSSRLFNVTQAVRPLLNRCGLLAADPCDMVKAAAASVSNIVAHNAPRLPSTLVQPALATAACKPLI